MQQLQQCYAAFRVMVHNELGGPQGHAELCKSGSVFVGHFMDLQNLDDFAQKALLHHAGSLLSLQDHLRLGHLKVWLRTEVLRVLLEHLLSGMHGFTPALATQRSQEWNTSGISFFDGLARVRAAQAQASNPDISELLGDWKHSSGGIVTIRQDGAFVIIENPHSGDSEPQKLLKSSFCSDIGTLSYMGFAGMTHQESVGLASKLKTISWSNGSFWRQESVASEAVVAGGMNTPNMNISSSVLVRSTSQNTGRKVLRVKRTALPGRAASKDSPSSTQCSVSTDGKLESQHNVSVATSQQHLSVASNQQHLSIAQTFPVAQASTSLTRSTPVRQQTKRKPLCTNACSQPSSVSLPKSANSARRPCPDQHKMYEEEVRVSQLLNEQGWALKTVDAATEHILRKLLQVQNPKSLGVGRDAKAYKRNYSKLDFYFAWQVVSPERKETYGVQRCALARDCNRVHKQGIRVTQVISKLNVFAQGLQDPLQDNEGWFLHGTKPETVLAILSSGLNERMCKGMFGKGVYFAEDIEKADQYTTPDSKYNAPGLEELHLRLFRPGVVRHPSDDIFYAFVVRAHAGVPVITKDGKTDVNGSLESIWASSSECRELAEVPHVTPPLRYHSVVVEIGGKVSRFREFVHFNSSRFSVEYLIAYQRVQ